MARWLLIHFWWQVPIRNDNQINLERETALRGQFDLQAAYPAMGGRQCAWVQYLFNRTNSLNWSLCCKYKNEISNVLRKRLFVWQCNGTTTKSIRDRWTIFRGHRQSGGLLACTQSTAFAIHVLQIVSKRDYQTQRAVSMEPKKLVFQHIFKKRRWAGRGRSGSDDLPEPKTPKTVMWSDSRIVTVN